jgi:type IV pilus assembly protein PilB
MLEIAENPIFNQTGQITAEQLRKEAQDETIVSLGRGMLLLGVKERASDIHIDPEENRVRVRYRIDGVLQDRMEMEKSLHPPVISWMKIQAELDITERRKPQDGRIKLQLNQKSIDYRFSTVPTIYGEKAVLRVLGQMESQEVPDIDEIGFSKSNYLKVKKCAEHPNGIFFVTGPTGSGKSTTLFSVLKHLNSPEVNIMTIEDPVEYRLPGINQIQVNKDIGLDFALSLRAFLRQDPDVILVGEIRDLETAKIASEAALTGHVVLATMHTNSAMQVVTRLIEMGVESYLIAPAMIGAISQRLVRRICLKCIEKYRPTPEQMFRNFIDGGKTKIYFHRGKGCQECAQTGYRGRMAIHEIFVMNPELRALISLGANVLDIETAARKTGFKSIRYDGIKKVIRGLTSIEEIERVAAVDED